MATRKQVQERAHQFGATPAAPENLLAYLTEAVEMALDSSHYSPVFNGDNDIIGRIEPGTGGSVFYLPEGEDTYQRFILKLERG